MGQLCSLPWCRRTSLRRSHNRRSPLATGEVLASRTEGELDGVSAPKVTMVSDRLSHPYTSRRLRPSQEKCVQPPNCAAARRSLFRPWTHTLIVRGKRSTASLPTHWRSSTELGVVVISDAPMTIVSDVKFCATGTSVKKTLRQLARDAFAADVHTALGGAFAPTSTCNNCSRTFGSRSRSRLSCLREASRSSMSSPWRHRCRR
jgi:hypothetical protein